MILSDNSLRWLLGLSDFVPKERLLIEPLDESRIQPASIDLTLDSKFQVGRVPVYTKDQQWMPEGREFQAFVFDPGIDLADVKGTLGESTFNKWEGDSIKIEPGQFILASTKEYVGIPNGYAARVEGKSSLARLGLLIHLTAGYIDPGFKGKITLEVVNMNQRPIILRAGLPICQLSIIEMTTDSDCPYGHESLKSKYQDQKDVTTSRYEG